MGNDNSILTIGYGNRTIDEFIFLLKNNFVRFLIDLRSSPYSKFKPEFNKDPLEAILKKNQIKYVYMGDSIGGLPSDRSCYTDNQVDYDKIKEKEFYNLGIERLIKASECGYPVAIMCSEGKPEMCHRSKLISVTLSEKGISVMHIDEDGILVSQEKIIRKIVGDQLDLFKKQTDDLKSKGKYQ